jgi:hypothetical protein
MLCHAMPCPALSQAAASSAAWIRTTLASFWQEVDRRYGLALTFLWLGVCAMFIWGVVVDTE